jgi:hypothetical protein
MLKPEYAQTINSILKEKAALEDKTLQYWKLKRCWNGIDYDKKLTVSSAMQRINNIQAELNPHRPLNLGLITLKDDIVAHGTKSKQRKHQVSVATKIHIL